MIEKMKVVHIVAAQTQKTELLDALRALGIVHFADKVDADQGYLERFAALSRALGDRFVGKVLPDSAANPDPAPFFATAVGCPHSVVTALNTQIARIKIIVCYSNKSLCQKCGI